jgi:hypothetical protein
VLRPNLAYSITAWAIYSDTSVRDVGKDAMWISSNPAIFDFYGDARVTTRAAGVADASATYASTTGTTPLQVFNSTITGVEASPARVVVPVGAGVKLTGVFKYDDGWSVGILNPSWSSLDSSIARVDPNGVVTGISAGTTSIRITRADGKGTVYTASVEAQVTAASISSLELDVPERMAVGSAAFVTATGVFTDGSRLVLSPSSVNFSSSDLTLATLMPDNEDRLLMRVLAPGNVTISARFRTAHTEKPVVLTSATLTGLSLSIPQTALPHGGTSPVSVEATFSDGTKLDVTHAVTYESTAPDVAYVARGMHRNSRGFHLIAQSAGKATIRARLENVTASVPVSVSGATLSSIALALDDGPPSHVLTITGRGPHKIRAVGTFSDGSTADVTPMCTFGPSVAGPGVAATVDNAFAGEVTVIGSGSEVVQAVYAPYVIGQGQVTGSAWLVVH